MITQELQLAITLEHNMPVKGSLQHCWGVVLLHPDKHREDRRNLTFVLYTISRQVKARSCCLQLISERTAKFPINTNRHQPVDMWNRPEVNKTIKIRCEPRWTDWFQRNGQVDNKPQQCGMTILVCLGGMRVFSGNNSIMEGKRTGPVRLWAKFAQWLRQNDIVAVYDDGFW